MPAYLTADQVLSLVYDSVTGRLKADVSVEVAAFTTAGVPAHTADATVDATAGGVVLLAANAARKSATIQNTGAANIRVAIGSNPAAGTGIQLGPGATLTLSMPFCPTGAIKAIREGGSSSTAAVLEVA